MIFVEEEQGTKSYFMKKILETNSDDKCVKRRVSLSLQVCPGAWPGPPVSAIPFDK